MKYKLFGEEYTQNQQKAIKDFNDFTVHSTFLCRFTVLSSGIKIPNAIGLARFEDKLFWADDTKMGVLKVDKYGDEDPQQIFQDQKNKRLRSVKIFHQSIQHQKDRASKGVGY